MSTFDERARDWDTPERSARAEAVAAAIRARLPLTLTTRAIEIGAGTGLLGFALAGDVGEMVLAEPSRGMLDVALEKLASARMPNVSAVRFDVVADPPPGDQFDLAISLLVLHHIADTGAALVGMHRLLRPGGRLAMCDLDAEDGSFHQAPEDDIPHHGFDRFALAESARAAGFVDVEAVTATELQRDERRYPVFLLVGRRP